LNRAEKLHMQGYTFDERTCIECGCKITIRNCVSNNVHHHRKHFNIYPRCRPCEIRRQGIQKGKKKYIKEGMEEIDKTYLRSLRKQAGVPDWQNDNGEPIKNFNFENTDRKRHKIYVYETSWSDFSLC